jgi:hypothetical protein
LLRPAQVVCVGAALLAAVSDAHGAAAGQHEHADQQSQLAAALGPLAPQLSRKLPPASKAADDLDGQPHTPHSPDWRVQIVWQGGDVLMKQAGVCMYQQRGAVALFTVTLQQLVLMRVYVTCMMGGMHRPGGIECAPRARPVQTLLLLLLLQPCRCCTCILHAHRTRRQPACDQQQQQQQ